MGIRPVFRGENTAHQRQSIGSLGILNGSVFRTSAMFAVQENRIPFCLQAAGVRIEFFGIRRFSQKLRHRPGDAYAAIELSVVHQHRICIRQSQVISQKAYLRSQEIVPLRFPVHHALYMTADTWIVLFKHFSVAVLQIHLPWNDHSRRVPCVAEGKGDSRFGIGRSKKMEGTVSSLSVPLEQIIKTIKS